VRSLAVMIASVIFEHEGAVVLCCPWWGGGVGVFVY
jgi:hypothetical protein